MRSSIYTKLQELPDEQKQLFVPLFGNLERFYATVYEIVHTEHETELQKLDHLEDRLQVIRHIKQKVIDFLSAHELPGETIWDDIASDYFEDYVAYRDPEITPLEHTDFIGILNKLLAESDH